MSFAMSIVVPEVPAKTGKPIGPSSAPLGSSSLSSLEHSLVASECVHLPLMDDVSQWLDDLKAAEAQSGLEWSGCGG